MPLSSTNAAQSIVRPGVCTSATRPASPFDGQVIYETDTDKTLVYNGTGWVFLSTSRANPGGLDFIKSQTIGSAVSSVTVSDVFSSTYDNYKITIAGGSASADMTINMTLGSTATGYYWSATGRVFGSTDQSAEEANSTAWKHHYVAGSSTLNSTMEVLSPFLSDETTFSASIIRAKTNGFQYHCGGYLNNTTSYTAFTLTCSTGTLTGGTIRVYGYVNS